MTKQWLPKGWTEERIRGIIAHYESLTDEQAAAEDDAAAREESQAMTWADAPIRLKARGMVTRVLATRKAGKAK